MMGSVIGSTERGPVGWMNGKKAGRGGGGGGGGR
jgi:hypothetical protein